MSSLLSKHTGSRPSSKQHLMQVSPELPPPITATRRAILRFLHADKRMSKLSSFISLKSDAGNTTSRLFLLLCTVKGHKGCRIHVWEKNNNKSLKLVNTLYVFWTLLYYVHKKNWQQCMSTDIYLNTIKAYKIAAKCWLENWAQLSSNPKTNCCVCWGCDQSP